LAFSAIFVSACAQSHPGRHFHRIPIVLDSPDLLTACETHDGIKGGKPEQDQITGMVHIVKSYLDSTVTHPVSLFFEGWSDIVEKEKCWIVRSEYVAENEAYTEKNHSTLFVIKNGRVIQTSELPILKSDRIYPF
jgi:hypothetical protein